MLIVMADIVSVFLGVKHPHASLSPGSGCAYVVSALNPHRKHLHQRNKTASCPHLRKVNRMRLDNIDQPCFSHATLCTSTQSLDVKTDNVLSGESSKSGDDTIDTSFNARMRMYMPGQHQEYLLWLENRSPFQRLAAQHSHHPGVRQAHRHALQALERWRNAHIQVVTQYVILPARRKFSREHEEDTKWSSRENPDADRMRIIESRQVVRGTGGTSLIPLLKAYRENTKHVRDLVVKVKDVEKERNSISGLLGHNRFGKIFNGGGRAALRGLTRFCEAGLLFLIVLLCSAII